MKEIIGTLLSVIIIVFLITFIFAYEYMNEQTIECKIKDKWTKRKNESQDLYLVNCGGKTYKIADLLFKGKFNSADIYGNLKKGKTYKIKVTGYRIGLFSEYQNINEYKLVK